MIGPPAVKVHAQLGTSRPVTRYLDNDDAFGIFSIGLRLQLDDVY